MYPAIDALISGNRYERFGHEEDTEDPVVVTGFSFGRQVVGVVTPKECTIDMPDAVEEDLKTGGSTNTTPVWARHIKKSLACIDPLFNKFKYLILGASVGLLIKDSIEAANGTSEGNGGIVDCSIVFTCTAFGVLYAVMKLVDDYYN